MGILWLFHILISLYHPYTRVRTGFGKFWKVLEIDNAIFQDLESFGKESIFKMAVEKFWIFIWKNSRNILKWM